jgi:hypothetical protein
MLVRAILPIAARGDEPATVLGAFGVVRDGDSAESNEQQPWPTVAFFDGTIRECPRDVLESFSAYDVVQVLDQRYVEHAKRDPVHPETGEVIHCDECQRWHLAICFIREACRQLDVEPGDRLYADLVSMLKCAP